MMKYLYSTWYTEEVEDAEALNGKDWMVMAMILMMKSRPHARQEIFRMGRETGYGRIEV